MKKMLMLFSVLVMWYGCGSQQDSQSTGPTAHGILTTAWGDVRDSVKAHLSTQGLVLVEDSADLVYSGGAYEGFPVDRWVLGFSSEGGLASGSIHFSPDTGNSVSQIMRIEAALTAKYGQPFSPLMWRLENDPSDYATIYRLGMMDDKTVELQISMSLGMAEHAGMKSDSPTVQ